ncbi:MAG TPA: hypothetical protein VIG97_08855 [Luteimonas sp.]
MVRVDLASAALLPTSLLAALQAGTPPPPDLSTWEAVRAQFPLDPAYMHIASFFLASHPVPVQQAIDTYRHAIDRNPFFTVEHGMFPRVRRTCTCRYRRRSRTTSARARRTSA